MEVLLNSKHRLVRGFKMVKDFDQLVEESKGRDLDAELAESKAQMLRGEGKRTTIIVSDTANEEDNS